MNQTLESFTDSETNTSPELQNSPAVTFGKALQASALDQLRQRLIELVADHRSPQGELGLHVEILPTRGGTTLGSTMSGSPELHLFLDVHRLFLFRPLANSGSTGVDSLIRFLRDGYPIQPLKRLEQYIENQGYRFLYPLAALDLLPLAWAELKPGEVAQLDLMSGAVIRTWVPDHPDVASSPWVDPSETLRPLQDRWVDNSLRQSFPPNLDGLLSAASVVQKRFSVRDRLSMPFTTTEVRWFQGRRRESCFGKSRRQDRAETVAMCEALERFQVANKATSEQLTYASYQEVQDRALDPHTLFFGRSPLSTHEELPIFDPQARLYWTTARPAGGGEPLLVPAQEVWFQTALLDGETPFIRSTTNGCALGGSVEEAALFGLLETVERDAFLTAWYLRRPAQRIDPDSIEDPKFHEFRYRWQLAYPGYRFCLFDITTDMALPTVMAVAVRRASGDSQDQVGPKVFFANACRPTAEAACRTALEDLAGFDPEMTAQRRSQFYDLLEHPKKVSGPAEHFGLYALDETYERLSFLNLDEVGDELGTGITAGEIQGKALIEVSDSYNIRELLGRIDTHSRALGVGVYFKDITHPLSAERGLHCVKAIAPGLFPVWFGHGSQRFLRTRRLEQLANAWFGEDTQAVQERLDHINLEMHPFS